MFFFLLREPRFYCFIFTPERKQKRTRAVTYHLVSCLRTYTFALSLSYTSGFSGSKRKYFLSVNTGVVIHESFASMLHV